MSNALHFRYDPFRIRRLDHDGLEYLADTGAVILIDFHLCARNWAKDRGETGAAEGNLVGWSDCTAKPPRYVFYTDPVTILEFDTTPEQAEAESSGSWPLWYRQFIDLMFRLGDVRRAMYDLS